MSIILEPSLELNMEFETLFKNLSICLPDIPYNSYATSKMSSSVNECLIWLGP